MRLLAAVAAAAVALGLVLAFALGGDGGPGSPRLGSRPAASASVSADDGPASAAQDGSPVTAWRSGPLGDTRPVSWQATLGAAQVVDEVLLDWTAGAADSAIQVSRDGGPWTTVDRSTQRRPPEGRQVRRFAPVRAGAVRVVMTRPGAPRRGFALAEVTLLGPGPDLALGKAQAAAAVDGSPTTGWRPAAGGPADARVDLGSVQPVEQAVVAWSGGPTPATTLETSRDGRRWSPAPVANEPTRGWRPFTRVVLARFARLRPLGATAGAALTTFALYGPGPDVAGGRPAGSSTAADGTPAGAASDGTELTRWASAFATDDRPEVWEVDLGPTRLVDTVTVAWTEAFARGYTVLTSIDGRTWTRRAQLSGLTTAATRTTRFTPVLARHVRLLMTGRTRFAAFSIQEVTVHGPAALAAPAEPQVLQTAGPDRAGGAPLAGLRLRGAAYVTAQLPGATRARFFLDDPGRLRAPAHTDETAPFDLVGERDRVALPLDTRRLASRAHTLTVVLDTPGGSVVRTVPFTVANAPSRELGLHGELRFARGADLAARVRLLGQAGARYDRDNIAWATVEPRAPRGSAHRYDWTVPDRFVGAAAAGGIEVVAIADDAPAWASANPNRFPRGGAAQAGYSAFLQAAIRRYGTQGSFWRAHPELPPRPVTRWNLWNEPYGGLGGAPDPAAYARFVRASVQAGRAAGDAAARFLVEASVVDGGGKPFLWPMFGAVPDLARYLDAVSVHPYVGQPTTPADCSYPGDTRQQLCRIRAVREVLDRAGAQQTSIWVTELGWSTARDPSDGRAVPAATQAQRVSQAFRALRGLDLADGVIWYSLEDGGGPGTDVENRFGLLRHAADSSRAEPKPAWRAFQAQARLGVLPGG